MIFFRDLWKLKAEFICHRNDCVLAVFCMGISTQAKSGLVSNFYASLVTSGEWTVHRFIIFIWSQMIRKLLEIDTLLRCSTNVKFWDKYYPNHSVTNYSLKFILKPEPAVFYYYYFIQASDQKPKLHLCFYYNDPQKSPFHCCNEL